MSSRYSEEEAVLKPAGSRWRKHERKLVYVWNEDELGQHDSFGLASYPDDSIAAYRAEIYEYFYARAA